MRRTLPLLALTGLALILPQITTAQNDAATDSPETTPEGKTDYRGPLPFYFGKLGLGDDQKQKLYAIDDDYAAKIDVLEKQIQKLKDERDARMETLLTPGQKLRLKELREEAAQREAENAKAEESQTTSKTTSNEG